MIKRCDEPSPVVAAEEVLTKLEDTRSKLSRHLTRIRAEHLLRERKMAADGDPS